MNYDRDLYDVPGERKCKQCKKYRDKSEFLSDRYPNLCTNCAKNNRKDRDREKARARRQKIKAENQAKRAAGK